MSELDEVWLTYLARRGSITPAATAIGITDELVGTLLKDSSVYDQQLRENTKESYRFNNSRQNATQHWIGRECLALKEEFGKLHLGRPEVLAIESWPELLLYYIVGNCQVIA